MALISMRQMLDAFGCAGNASKITPLSLEVMQQRYASGELDQKIA